MAQRLTLALDNGSTLNIVATQRGDGDFAIMGEPNGLDERRKVHCPSPWSVCTQVHGREVVEVGRTAVSGDDADALITAELQRPLAIQTADCAPVVLYGPGPWFGVAHAGWKGLQAGVIEATVARITKRGGVVAGAWVGPCIGAECYAFSSQDLAQLAGQFGPSVVAGDSVNGPSFDLRAALASVMDRVGVSKVEMSDTCTSCSSDHFSHRARSDSSRMATVAWTER
jgi:YfiH family protein